MYENDLGGKGKQRMDYRTTIEEVVDEMAPANIATQTFHPFFNRQSSFASMTSEPPQESSRKDYSNDKTNGNFLRRNI
jgi:hypothetical protein